ncbi:MAG TPA: hypothetical protein ENJ77_00145 [Candidatus Moranbacteria bacterium]|nr:hypothetical protein [Candidatus Moranbacteria bacterium]
MIETESPGLRRPRFARPRRDEIDRFVADAHRGRRTKKDGPLLAGGDLGAAAVPGRRRKEQQSVFPKIAFAVEEV